MKVLYDHQMFSHQRIGGVSKYFAELLRNLPREVWDTSTVFSENQYVEDYQLFDTRTIFKGVSFKGKGRLMLEMGIPYTMYKLLMKKYDVYHQTHYELFSMCGTKGKPMVTTYHDLNFFTYNRNKRLMIDSRISLNRADKIIAISNSTKNGLINMLGIPEEKIVTIYHGIDDYDMATLDSKPLFDFPYILYVGNRSDSFKNFERFIKAFAIITYKNPDIYLVCSGLPYTEDEKKIFYGLNISKKCFTYYASEVEMKKLYRDALCFVYPSISEGFGMPLLEAMQCGCPNALSNSSCFPEIAQDAAVYFNPESVSEMVDVIIELINNDLLREMIIKKGKLRVKDFSWTKTAQEHLNLYSSLI